MASATGCGTVPERVVLASLNPSRRQSARSGCLCVLDRVCHIVMATVLAVSGTFEFGYPAPCTLESGVNLQGPLNCLVSNSEVNPIPNEPNLNIFDSKVVYSTRYVDNNKQQRNYYLSKILRLYKFTARRKLVSPKIRGESQILRSNPKGSAKGASDRCGQIWNRDGTHA